MAVKVVERRYSNPRTPGFVSWPIGNVGDWQSLVVICDTATEVEFTQNSPLRLEAPNRLVRLDGGDWNSDGFEAGDSIVLNYTIDLVPGGGGPVTTIPVALAYVIDDIQGDTLEITSTFGPPAIPIYPGELFAASGDRAYIYNVFVYADKRPEACEFTFNHLTNDDVQTNNLNSLIDGNKTRWQVNGIDTLAVAASLPMQAVGYQSGMATKGGAVVYRGKIGTHTYRHDIFLQFMIANVWEQRQELIDCIPPDSSKDNNSLTDNFAIKMYPRFNDPNIVVQNDLNDSQILGNEGWFEENFNGGDNDYEVVGMQYTDAAGASVDALDYGNLTKIKATIKADNPALFSNGNTEFQFRFMWVPADTADYHDKETPFHQNTFTNSHNIANFSQVFTLGSSYMNNYQGWTAVSGARMDVQNPKFTQVGPDTVEFTADFVPTPGFKTFFDPRDDDRKYILWVSVADHTLDTNDSNLVPLKLDINDMEFNVPPAGPYDLIQNWFLEHPYAETATGVFEYSGFVKDDILRRIPFWIPTNVDRAFQSMKFVIRASNPTTGESYDLDEVTVDLSSAPAPGGIQQFNVDTTRGFQTPAGNNKNWVKVYREPALDFSVNTGYQAYCAFKIRWEDWIERLGVPADFYDASEENNGFHNDWIHYLRTAGWQIEATTEIVALEDGELVQYENPWLFTFNDYDENTNLVTTHEYFRDSDGAPLNIGADPVTGDPLGVILSNEPVRVVISYQKQDGSAWEDPPNNVYATMTLEVSNGPGFLSMDQISSVYGTYPSNPQRPLVGELGVKIEVDGSDPTILRTTALIDPATLAAAPKFEISGRVGCLSQTASADTTPGEGEDISGSSLEVYNGQWGLEFT